MYYFAMKLNGFCVRVRASLASGQCITVIGMEANIPYFSAVLTLESTISISLPLGYEEQKRRLTEVSITFGLLKFMASTFLIVFDNGDSELTETSLSTSYFPSC